MKWSVFSLFKLFYITFKAYYNPSISNFKMRMKSLACFPKRNSTSEIYNLKSTKKTLEGNSDASFSSFKLFLKFHTFGSHFHYIKVVNDDFIHSNFCHLVKLWNDRWLTNFRLSSPRGSFAICEFRKNLISFF